MTEVRWDARVGAGVPRRRRRGSIPRVVDFQTVNEMAKPRFTNRELDIMSVLWELGEATVADVREALGEDVAYTTVQTQLRLLELKGAVTHRKEGRQYIYRAKVAPEAAGKGVLDRILRRIYQDSPLKLMTHLVSDRDIPEDELRAMRDLLEERLRERRRR